MKRYFITALLIIVLLAVLGAILYTEYRYGKEGDEWKALDAVDGVGLN